jgi:hypothetical protein
MCAITAAAVAGTVATVASVGMSVASQTGAMGGGSSGGGAGGFSEQQLKGFAPTKGLQSYAARLLAMNATATRPSLQDFAQSGGTAKYPITDTGFTPEEAANLSIVDPHTGRAEPYVGKGQTSLTPAQQVFLGQQRARQGATGPLAQLGMLTAKQQGLQAKGQTTGVAGSAAINKKLGNIGTKLTKVQTKLSSGGGGFPGK